MAKRFKAGKKEHIKTEVEKEAEKIAEKVAKEKTEEESKIDFFQYYGDTFTDKNQANFFSKFIP